MMKLNIGNIIIDINTIENNINELKEIFYLLWNQNIYQSLIKNIPFPFNIQINLNELQINIIMNGMK